ncbi:MAG: hypothetical protein P4L85_16315 [Paludisphaera borealis]|uniref:hypothetical protein n=1 Tax=Paludisphaera borealis TaxID=1387353 RepID=UPI0028403987|nr:hypothetical protein [Paludisphaera borealis]MDR3620917.1 hypothetical protein [Paludisphaera borealis]
MEMRASAFMSDRAGGLWLGSDHGEWGGEVMRVDLEKGSVQNIPGPKSSFFSKGKPYWSGILGFVELRDGQIWAHGGSMHGMGDGFIARIDNDGTSQLYELRPHWPLHEDEAGPEPPPELELSRPVLPVTQIIEQDDDLLVISYSGGFRVDKSLKDWKAVNRLEIPYPWLKGHRNGMGAYAVVEVAHPPARSGEPFVLATIEDGYITLEGAKAVPHAIPGQVDTIGIDDVTNSVEGLLLRDRFDLRETEVSTVWRLGKEGWETVDFSPPFEMAPANPEPNYEEDYTSWHFPYVLVRPDGAIFTVNQSRASPGTRTVARWTDGKAVRMGREVSYNYSTDSFITPDGVLWNDSLGRLLRFQNGKWEVAAGKPYDPVSLEPIQGNLYTPGRVKPIPTKGPPWILLAPWDQALWRLAYEADGKNTKLARLKLDEGAGDLKILDAIPWTGDLLMLATSAGLRTYDPAKGKLARVDLPEPPKPASKLARDGVDRLWLGGENGLWLSEKGAKEVESLDPVPAIKGTRVDAIGPDPAHADGVVAVLQDRGIVFLRTKAVR